MSKTTPIKLPKQLWNDETIDLTRHSYQGKLLNKNALYTDIKNGEWD